MAALNVCNLSKIVKTCQEKSLTIFGVRSLDCGKQQMDLYEDCKYYKQAILQGASGSRDGHILSPD
jgi:hypothetical protein